jgi:hypothetical protein
LKSATASEKCAAGAAKSVGPVNLTCACAGGAAATQSAATITPATVVLLAPIRNA